MRLDTAERIYKVMKKMTDFNIELEKMENRKLVIEEEIRHLQEELDGITVLNEDDDEPLEFPSKLQKALEATISENGITRDEIKGYLEISSMKHLTKGEARKTIKDIEEIKEVIENRRMLNQPHARPGRIRL